MKFIIRVIPIIIVFTACKASYSEFLVGNWYRTDDYVLVDQKSEHKKLRKERIPLTPPRPPSYTPLGFTFQPHGTVIFYPDFWKKSGEEWNYHGDMGNYEITKDSLLMTLPGGHGNNKKYAWKKDGSNLVLNGANGELRLNRFFTEINTYQPIDSIRQFITNGWGYWEEQLVSKSGKTEWIKPVYGESKSEHFIGFLTREEFDKLEWRYNWAEFMDLGDYSNCCDGREVKTVFYADGKEIKIVKDYEDSTPMRFIWATRLMNSYVEKTAKNKVDGNSEKELK